MNLQFLSVIISLPQLRLQTILLKLFDIKMWHMCHDFKEHDFGIWQWKQL